MMMMMALTVTRSQEIGTSTIIGPELQGVTVVKETNKKMTGMVRNLDTLEETETIRVIVTKEKKTRLQPEGQIGTNIDNKGPMDQQVTPQGEINHQEASGENLGTCVTEHPWYVHNSISCVNTQSD